MKLSPNELGRLLAEKDSERVTLQCGRHRYVASKIPPETRGCKDCWMAYYTYDIASTPPHLRQERLDELESVIRHVAEFAETGKFGKDFELYEPGDKRFQVEYEKDAL